MAGLSKDSVEAVDYEQPLTLSSLLLGSARAQQPSLADLLDLATPKAYYLYTMLPVFALKD